MAKKASEVREPDVETLRRALTESLKLQSHYAELLNMYDGGHRLTFDSIESWLKRLELVEHNRRMS